MEHCVYKITNLIDGKFYIGKHSTDKIDDNYFGSGNRIRRALSKYGKSNFKKEIIQIFETEQEAYDLEELLTKDIVNTDICYNLKVGGRGGMTGYIQSDETRKKHSDGLIGLKRPPRTKEHIENLTKAITGRSLSIDHKRSLGRIVYQYDLNGNYITSFHTVREAADAISGTMTTIALCANGKRKTSNKFIWSYEDKCKSGS